MSESGPTARMWRLYADSDGHSDFERMDIDYSMVPYAPPAPEIGVSEATEATRYIMVRFPQGWDSELHVSPRRQHFLMLAGRFEGETSLGKKIELLPGDQVLMEDTTGFGHSARVLGNSDVRAVMIHLD